MNQMLYSAPQTNPLVDAIRNQSHTYLSGLVNNNQLNSQQANHILGILNENVANMANNLASQSPNGVLTSSIDQLIASYTRQILTQLQPQIVNLYSGRTTQPTPIISSSPALNTTFGSPSLANPANPEPRVTYTPPPEPVQVTERRGVLRMGTRSNPPRNYRIEDDPNASAYSTKSRSGNIVDVKRKAVITGTDGEKYNYYSVECFVPEPTIGHVIRNLTNTNPRMVTGKYIIEIDYCRFILRDVPTCNCSAIDLSPLRAPDRKSFPVDDVIGKVIKSIGSRDWSVVSCISEILTSEFNDRLKRYVRLESDIDKIMRAMVMSDITTIGSIRDRKMFGDLVIHPNYEERIFRCFVEALSSVINDMTKIGFYDVLDIAPNLLACPNFVIRDHGIIEREMDIKDPNFVSMIENKFTAFANDGNIVITNFIPDELDTDICDYVIKVGEITNPIEELIMKVWRGSTHTIMMRDEQKELVVKTGITLDGAPFMFEDAVNLGFDL